jgi:hypothetical protein
MFGNIIDRYFFLFRHVGVASTNKELFLKKKLQSVAIFKKTPIFVMRRCSSAAALQLKKYLRLAAV